MGDLFLLWAVVEVLGLLCVPLTFAVFRNLADRGWALSKALGLMVLAFCIWLPLVCFPTLLFSQALIACVLCVLLALGLVGFVRGRHEIAKVLRHNLVYVLASEAVFLGMVSLMGWLHVLGPEINGDEGFMDIGLIASIMRSPHLPPPDMWLAGYTVNYYYYTQYMIALLAKLVGQGPTVAFNTGVCVMFGLCAVNVFGVTCNVVAWARQRQKVLKAASETQAVSSLPALLPTLPYGIAGCLFTLVAGNLAAVRLWWTLRPTWNYTFWNFWGGSIYVLTPLGKTFNEFPAYSFLLKAAHAYSLALAFTVLALGLAFSLLLEPEGKGLLVFGRGWRAPVTLVVAAMILGGLYVMNGWDYPTYVGITLVCLVLQQWLAHESRFSWPLLRNVLLVGVSLPVLSYLLYLPYYLHFTSPAAGLGQVAPKYHSLLSDEVWIYGFLAFMFLSFLLTSIFTHPLPARPTQEILEPATRWRLVQHVQQLRQVLYVVGATVYPILCILCLRLIPTSGTLVLSTSLALIATVLIFQHMHNRGQAFVLLLGATAWALVAFCELFYIKDAFANSDYERMNTVFKFYYQAWVLLSIACAVGLFFILERLQTRKGSMLMARAVKRAVFVGWTALFVVLIAASMVYPLNAPYSRYAHLDAGSSQPYFTSAGTLDGMAFMQHCSPPSCSYDTAPDYYAIRWLNTHVQGNPIIIEAPGNDYSDGSRISAFTGLPTLMGWIGHEYQWRIGSWYKNDLKFLVDYARRVPDIEQIYTSKDAAKVLTLMAHYNATYLYVGPLERAKYPHADLKRYGKFMQSVYNAHGATIYKVYPAGTLRHDGQASLQRSQSALRSSRAPLPTQTLCRTNGAICWRHA